MKKLFTLVSLVLGLGNLPVMAQLPNCNNFYYHQGSTIYQYNTTTNTSSTNTITLPGGAGGLCVSNNLNGGSPAVTFYTSVNSNLYYYNGATWVNTGHTVGNASAINLGGAGPYIYCLNGIGQQVYRYDGTGNAVLMLNLPGWGGPFDVIGDAAGNVYVLNTSGPNTLNMYSPTGTLICTYNLVGFPSGSYGGGYAIVNNNFYATIGGTDCRGTISGTTITYTGTLTLTGGSPSDYANCEFPPLLANIAAPSPLTCGAPSTILTASSTLTNPQYTWAGPGVVSGGNTNTPTVNQPGTYTVTVTGSGGCTSMATATCVVTQTGGFTLAGNITHVTCFGNNTGGIDLTASNGSAPYTYSWSTGGSMEDPTGMAPGTYTVNVTDNSGCTQSATYTVNGPTSAITATTTTVNALCGTPTGSASVTAAGGMGGYTYNWQPSGGTSTNASNLAPATYTVTVTDANGCTTTSSATVVGTSSVTIDNVVIDSVNCLGGNDGSITVTPGNGVAPYNFVWSSGSGLATAANLTAGNYTVTITDNTGCSVTGTYTLAPGSNPPQVDFVADDPIGCTVHCVNFTIPATIPTSNLQTYQWLVNGIPVGANTAALSHCFNTAGDYDISLDVVDNNGCVNAVNKIDYVNVEDYPVADFTTDKPTYLESDPEVEINDASYNAVTLHWNMGDGQILNNLTSFSYTYSSVDTFCIQLVAVSSLGCADTTSHCIIVEPVSTYYIPNAFTPNGDGLNEVFYPVGANIKKYSMLIYDRWGETIFTSSKDDDVWNGNVNQTSKLAPQGVYVYTIIITDAQDQQIEFRGHVNMIR